MLYLLTSGLKLKVNEVQLTDYKVKSQTNSIFQLGHWPHPSPYPTTMRIIYQDGATAVKQGQIFNQALFQV